MKELYKTLIVEDHVSTARGIECFLDQICNSTGTKFNTQVASNLGDALIALETKPLFDLVFLDIRLEPQPEIGLNSGEDLGIEIRKLYPGTLIIVSTFHDEPFYIGNIFKNVKPEGFFVKGDLDNKGFIGGIISVLDETPYLSKTVVKCLSDNLNNDIKIDIRDRQLLFEIEKGLTMEKVAENLFVSRTTAFKWKRKLKIIFEVEEGSDRDLINKARELGFI